MAGKMGPCPTGGDVLSCDIARGVLENIKPKGIPGSHERLGDAFIEYVSSPRL